MPQRVQSQIAVARGLVLYIGEPLGICQYTEDSTYTCDNVATHVDLAGALFKQQQQAISNIKPDRCACICSHPQKPMPSE